MLFLVGGERGLICAPEALEVILNCQLPSMFGPGDAAGEVTPPAPLSAPLVVPWYPAPRTHRAEPVPIAVTKCSPAVS